MVKRYNKLIVDLNTPSSINKFINEHTLKSGYLDFWENVSEIKVTGKILPNDFYNIAFICGAINNHLHNPNDTKDVIPTNIVSLDLSELEVSKIRESSDKVFLSKNGIPPFTFHHLPSIERVKLPKTLNVIGGDSFRGCTNLTFVEWPKVPYIIGPYAFEDTSVSRIIIDNNFKSAGAGAFRNAHVSDIVIPFNFVIDIDPTFLNAVGIKLEDIKLHVPDHLVFKYLLDDFWGEAKNVESLTGFEELIYGDEKN